MFRHFIELEKYKIRKNTNNIIRSLSMMHPVYVNVPAELHGIMLIGIELSRCRSVLVEIV